MNNIFEITFPNFPENMINFTKVVAIMKCEDVHDSSKLYVNNHIEIWEKKGNGYKLTILIDADTEDRYAQAYIDVKLYIYNERDYYGIQKYSA